MCGEGDERRSAQTESEERGMAASMASVCCTTLPEPVCASSRCGSLPHLGRTQAGWVGSLTRNGRIESHCILALPQQLTWGGNGRFLVPVSRVKVGQSFLRSLSIRFATAEDVEAEKEMIEEDAMERMEKTLEATKANFNTVRTGRASPSLLDRVEVEYYGTPVILKSVAQVSTPDGSTILVQPFDKSSLVAIEKALIKSDLGLTPSSDGSVIRLNIPQLTEDRRKELLKLVSRLTEDGKVALRNVRRDAIKSYEKLEKEKKLSEDNVKDLSVEIQKLTDEYVKKIETLFKQKEKELTTV